MGSGYRVLKIATEHPLLYYKTTECSVSGFQDPTAYDPESRTLPRAGKVIEFILLFKFQDTTQR